MRAATVAKAARLGQVFTPPALADFTLALALEGRDPRRVRVLDPACGDGVFLARARAAGVPAEQLAGVDVDPVAATAARSAAPGVAVKRADFFAESPPSRREDAWDLVVGNPPYVRQELLGAAGKARVVARVAADWPGVSWPARADLAAAFVARALRFVKPGGRVAFVLSTALLDAAYFEALAALAAGPARARVVAVVASDVEKWFADADIHAAVVVLEREGPAVPARFVRLAAPVATRTPSSTVRTVPAAEAWTAPWGALLRAPSAWWAARDAAGDALVPLGDLADVWRGATSGANHFFYLSRAETAAAGIEPRFLVPLLRSPRAARAPRLDPAALPTLAFRCELATDAALAAFPGAAAWVRRHAALAAQPSLSVRTPWWSLPTRPAQVFLSKAYDVRFAQFFAPAPLLADQRVYAAAPHDPARLPPELLAAVLSGSLTALAIESLGRASLGQGALELSVADARALPVLDPRRLSPRQAGAVLAAWAPLSRRAVLPAAAEATAPDRAALDAALGTPDAAAVRAAWAAAVAARVNRSR